MKTLLICSIVLLLLGNNAMVSATTACTEMACMDMTLGMVEANPATSCNDIYRCNPLSRGNVGDYWIRGKDELYKVTCNMKLKCGGIEGGWMQVVDVDMNKDSTCPATWKTITTPRRLCIGSSPGCASAHFSTHGVTFEHICGQTKSYQKGIPDAFAAKVQSIDQVYVDGISITLGSPRKHVWTYAISQSDSVNTSQSNCPCAPVPGASPPAFVKDDYYCESGTNGHPMQGIFYTSDPLWDGQGCPIDNGCCAQMGMPKFYRKTLEPSSDNIEVRICKNEAHSDEDVAIEELYIYVL